MEGRGDDQGWWRRESDDGRRDTETEGREPRESAREKTWGGGQRGTQQQTEGETRENKERER